MSAPARRDGVPFLLAGALLCVGAVVVLTSRAAARSEFADALSTYRAEPQGSRALYLLAEEAGLPVERHLEDFAPAPADGTLLLLGAHFEDEGPPDATDGGVGVALEGPSFRSHAVTGEELEALLERIRGGLTVVHVLPSPRRDPLLTAARVGVRAGTSNEGPPLRTLVPPVPSLETAGVSTVEAEVASWLTVPGSAEVLLRAERSDDVALARVALGLGSLVVLAAPDLATNRALIRADNAQLWLSLLGSLPGPLRFDEFHHGFTQPRSVARFARAHGLHLAVLQLLLGLVLWALSLRAFGRPRGLPQELRVSSRDALQGVARVYREGRHHAEVAGLVVRGLTFSLARTAGRAPGSAVAELARALEARRQAPLAAALLEADARAREAASDADVATVVKLAARIHRQVRLDGLGGRSAGWDRDRYRNDA